MQSNYWIFLPFALSLNFPSLVKVGQSGAPFGFIFSFILVFPYLLQILSGKRLIDIKVFSLIGIFLITIIWGLYSAAIDMREFTIRILQIFSVMVVYIYSREGFFISISNYSIVKILLICQLPSLLFGFFEMIYAVTNSEFIYSQLYSIRGITASGREDVIGLKTITLHFLEHSMSSFYFISILIILALVFQNKTERNRLKQDINLQILIIIFLMLCVFHRSTTFILVFLFAGIFATIYTRKIWLFLLFIPFILLFVYSAPQIFIKFSALTSGSFLSSDVFRASTIISSFTTFFDTFLIGSGAGTFSQTYYDGLVSFFNHFNFGYEIENIFLANNYIDSYKFGNRAPLNSAYSVLISEYGIFFILFLFYFHGKSYRLLTIFDLLEMTLIICLFLSYPIAYPYLWLSLGLLHRARKQSNELK